MAEPRVIYEAGPGSPFHGDRPFYDRLRAETPTLLDRSLVPTRSGRAWPVRAGQLLRIVAVEGPQVADFNAWSLHSPRARSRAAGSPRTAGSTPALAPAAGASGRGLAERAVREHQLREGWHAVAHLLPDDDVVAEVGRCRPHELDLFGEIRDLENPGGLRDLPELPEPGTPA